MRCRACTVSVTLAALFALATSVPAATIHVANNGIDHGCGVSVCILGQPCHCGTKTLPCRSITCAIATAAPGDQIVVGPGVYSADLNGNGTIGEPGEEVPSAGCGCALSLNKSVSLVSSDGAAVTVIDARTVDVAKNVLIIADGSEFGRAGKGFTVTNTANSGGAGIIIDSNDVKVRGNQVVATGMGRVRSESGARARFSESGSRPSTLLRRSSSKPTRSSGGRSASTHSGVARR